MKNLFFVLSVLLVISCNSGEKQTSSNLLPTLQESKLSKKESNAITQSLPTIMVVPSDAMLKRMGCLDEEITQGVTNYKRDYSKSYIKDSRLKFVIAAIEGEFSKYGFNLENMEQALKLIDNNNAMDEAEGVARDLRAELMSTTRPDYIIELDYELKQDPSSRNPNKVVTYIVKCIDVFTNKTVTALTRANAGIESKDNDIQTLFKNDFTENFSEIKNGITNHFMDVLANGSEITLRVAVLNSSAITLEDDCGGDEITEKIIDWMKENTINSTYKMVKNTSTELLFTNVRIYTQDENNNSYTAYDFARELRKGLRNGCSLDVVNKTQSLGDAFIQIK